MRYLAEEFHAMSLLLQRIIRRAISYQSHLLRFHFEGLFRSLRSDQYSFYGDCGTGRELADIVEILEIVLEDDLYILEI